MDLFKRMLMIISMIALTSFAADKGKNLFSSFEGSMSHSYKRAIKLYESGCENIEMGYVKDTNKCIKAYSLLKDVVSENQNTFEANLYLSKIYIYQPNSFNWKAKGKSDLDLKKLGLRHLNKALQLDPKHLEARAMLSQIEIKKASSIDTQGL